LYAAQTEGAYNVSPSHISAGRRGLPAWLERIMIGAQKGNWGKKSGCKKWCV
jgi:hypothetical protein